MAQTKKEKRVIARARYIVEVFAKSHYDSRDLFKKMTKEEKKITIDYIERIGESAVSRYLYQWY
jgi:hypothetical protein